MASAQMDLLLWNLQPPTGRKNWHGGPSPVGALRGVTAAQAVTIGAGSWIGQHSIVMPGVTSGKNAVVGANSVVTRDVPARGVAVGAPARVVRVVVS